MSWEKFRRETNRVDCTFLDKTQREGRVCTSGREADFFLKGLLRLAEEYQARDETVLICMDVESDLVHSGTKSRRPTDRFYWFREQLQRQKESRERIGQRVKYQEELTKKWKKYKPMEKD